MPAGHFSVSSEDKPIAENIQVNITAPYDPSTARDVAILEGNQTVWVPSEVRAIPRHITLTIGGNQAWGAE